MTLSEAIRFRLTALGIGVVALAFGAIDGFFGAQELLYLLRGFTEKRPVITSSHYSGTALLLAPMAFIMGLICLFGKRATPEQMKEAAGKKNLWGRAFLLFVAGSILAAFAAPIVQYIAVSVVATNRGYVSCPTPNWPRHQPDRWAVSPERCPGEGADPNL